MLDKEASYTLKLEIEAIWTDAELKDASEILLRLADRADAAEIDETLAAEIEAI